ncbi:MAG: competence protein TfoX [Clostridia bacterium]|jgi:TfoX/Sxy family transcriptional regulator of competence genes|nr:competence protein TfoX [Clostridia bacterium]MCX4367336.1 competence protein TfoX [Clostridia bacterium]
MATDKGYVGYVMDMLGHFDGVSTRAMMGEYVLYFRDKVIGGIYNNRVLLKRVPAIDRMIPKVKLEIPYNGAKEMVLLEDIENRTFTKELFESMYDELPINKKRKK